jgi:hypothetical protein
MCSDLDAFFAGLIKVKVDAIGHRDPVKMADCPIFAHLGNQRQGTERHGQRKQEQCSI